MQSQEQQQHMHEQKKIRDTYFERFTISHIPRHPLEQAEEGSNLDNPKSKSNTNLKQSKLFHPLNTIKTLTSTNKFTIFQTKPTTDLQPTQTKIPKETQSPKKKKKTLTPPPNKYTIIIEPQKWTN